MIGQAQTGTGKTAAFGLPIMQYIDPSEPSVQALVLTPTRELCIQVTQALRTYGAHSGVDVVAVFGGAPIRTQQAQLRAGGHVVVGTVGRVLDLISRHSLVLHDCRFVVLDEADEMLDLGLPRGRREDPLADTLLPADGALLGHDAAADPQARRPLHVRPDDHPGRGRDAHDRHRRAVPAAGRRQEQARQARRGAARGGARAGDRLRAHEDPLRPALPHAARPRDERAGRCTATCPRARATA